MQHRLVVYADVLGQAISPIFKGQAVDPWWWDW